MIKIICVQSCKEVKELLFLKGFLHHADCDLSQFIKMEQQIIFAIKIFISFSQGFLHGIDGPPVQVGTSLHPLFLKRGAGLWVRISSQVAPSKFYHLIHISHFRYTCMHQHVVYLFYLHFQSSLNFNSGFYQLLSLLSKYKSG